MYKVKNTVKGELTDFDIGSYNRESYLLQSREELNRLIEGEGVEYYFQPIIAVRDGSLFAYEALLRSKLKTLKNPAEILTLAKKEAQLGRIEALTWFKALEAFTRFVKEGVIQPECRIFINSIPNQWLSPTQVAKLEQHYGAYLHLVVQELTEEEKVNEIIQQQKSVTIGRWQAKSALDDFGSGYNSERALLTLGPDFVKVDMSLIRGIDTDLNRQSMVRSMSAYAHERDICVIAEGVETLGEAQCVVTLGVDYIQGYFLARPSAYPPAVPKEKSRLLQELYRRTRQGEAGGEGK